MDLSNLGLLGFVDGMKNREVVQFARRIEKAGYSVLWVPEVMGREIFSLSTHLLSQTEHLVVGTGVAIAFAYEPIVTACATRTLGEFFEDRFILGLGVSNQTYNARRGVGYDKPVAFMRGYLEKIKTVPYNAPKPQQEPPIVLAGMMPKMLQLAGSATQGTLTYFTTTQQVTLARETLGPTPWLLAVQLVMLETDAAKARTAARKYMQIYMAIDHYLYRLRKIGYTDVDFANGGSDRLVDAIIAWGSEDQLRQHIAGQFKAGATHVSILPLRSDGKPGPDERAIEALAPERN